jgi:hypothetical protein
MRLQMKYMVLAFVSESGLGSQARTGRAYFGPSLPVRLLSQFISSSMVPASSMHVVC